MRNIFIDLGCYDGDTVEEFRNWSKVAFPDRSDWKIYAFDPNPKFKHNWKKKSNDNTFFEQSAAWIKDGEIEVAIDQTDTPRGTTVMPSKVAIWDNFPHIIVKCFDFSKWIEKFKDDFLVVKMDAEGAEFPILEKMIRDGTDKLVDRLMVEFHPNKVREYTTTYKNDLIQRLQHRGVDIKEWH